MNDDPSGRILSLEDAVLFRQHAAAAGGRVVLTNGCFDLLHRGHLEYLRQSAALGDHLIVAINSDASVRQLKGPDRPVNREQDRAYALTSLRCVDAVIVFPTPTLTDEIRRLRPDVYTKAGDYTLETLNADERAALLAAGTSICFMPFLAGFSTTQLIRRLAAASA